MQSEYLLYDQLLIGKKETMGKEMFESTVNGRKEYNEIDEQKTIKVLKYALEYYMGWTPEQVQANLSFDILRRLKLEGIILQRIKFPLELDDRYILNYIIHLLYPERYSYDQKQAIINYYDGILDGKIKRFKKGFFSADEGKYRADICLRRMLQRCGVYTNVRQLYDLFSSTAGRKKLVEYKLSNACKEIYTLPIDFLHFALPKDMRDEMYYRKKRFEIVNDKQKKEYMSKGDFIL